MAFDVLQIASEVQPAEMILEAHRAVLCFTQGCDKFRGGVSVALAAESQGHTARPPPELA